MAVVRVDISGSTVTEAIVASVIFLIFFFVSAESISRLGISGVKDSPEAYINAGNCISDLSRREFDDGEYTFYYNWGEITVTAREYTDFAEVQELLFRISVKNEKRQLIYRFLTTAEQGYE